MTRKENIKCTFLSMMYVCVHVQMYMRCFIFRCGFFSQVSPQFCDDLTENGMHLKVNRRAIKKKTPQPLQEVRELFPDAAKNVEKSAVKRNPLEFKQNAADERSVVGFQHKSRSTWSSPDISLYPSTCAPRSKVKLSDITSERSDDESNSDEKKSEYCNNQVEDDVDCHDDRLDYRGIVCNEFDHVGWSDNQIDGRECDVDHQINEDKSCRECPSLAQEQTSHVMQSPSLDDHMVPCTPLQQEEEKEGEGGSEDGPMRLRLSGTTELTETRNFSQLRESRPEISKQDIPVHSVPGSQSSSAQDEETTTCRRTTPNGYSKFELQDNSVHSEQLAEAATSKLNPPSACSVDKSGKSIGYAGCSLEDLSELVKDMSMGDEKDQVSYTMPCKTSSVTQSSECSNSTKKDRSMYTQRCQETFNRMGSCSHQLNRFDVSTFKPPAASTPFRDQSSPTRLLSNLRGDRAPVMSYKSPTTAYSDNFGTRSMATPTSQRDHEMSILVRETPEHQWCSPKLAANVRKHGSKTDDKTSFEIAESFIQPVSDTNSSGKCKNRSYRQQLVCSDIDDIDMTTFNNFDDSDSRLTTQMETSSKCDTCPVIPPTQDSTHNSEGEWSILAKLTPDELWCSPVVKMVDNSLNSQ